MRCLSIIDISISTALRIIHTVVLSFSLDKKMIEENSSRTNKKIIIDAKYNCSNTGVYKRVLNTNTKLN